MSKAKQHSYKVRGVKLKRDARVNVFFYSEGEGGKLMHKGMWMLSYIYIHGK